MRARDSKADGIIQISTGGRRLCIRHIAEDSALGAISIAEHVHRVADRIRFTLRCTRSLFKDKLEKFVIPLVEETEKRRAAGQPNLFTGTCSMAAICRCRRISTFPRSCSNASPKRSRLEIETGAVGGEEDDVVGDHAAKLYTTPEGHARSRAPALNSIGGRYCSQRTFGMFTAFTRPVA